MKVVLTCRECGHQQWGMSERELMNKVKMWNHVRAAHPHIDAAKINLVMKVTYPYQQGQQHETLYPAFE